MQAPYLTAVQAAEELGVTRATLYAYISRGQLQSEPVPGQPREHRYRREDIERLRERKAARRDPDGAASRGLHWGSPVLESGITLIQDGALYYRGHDALRLARDAGLEELAALLWGAVPDAPRIFDPPCPLPQGQLARLRNCARDPLTVFQMALPLAAETDPAAHDLRPAAVRRSGARIINLFLASIAGRSIPAPAHHILQAAWAPKHKAAADAIRVALVLCADHELNVSAFTARCAASAGASPYDVISAAAAALRGLRHGGQTERANALLAEIRTPAQARTVVADRLRRGDGLPGFGHRLYPAGDPRAKALLRVAQAGSPQVWRLVNALRRAGTELLQEGPNLDCALAALARAHSLPESAPLVLFALGRTVGWIAHAIEQYAGNELIRPRARYTGPLPELR